MEEIYRSFADFMANIRIVGNIVVAFGGTLVVADIRMV